MKPNHVVNISLKSLTQKEYNTKLDRDVMRLHLRDYQRAGVPVPDAVIEQAHRLGVEVEA